MERQGSINRRNNRSCSNNVASSSTTRPRGRKCRCGIPTILMTTRRGKYIGRQFWRCPYWMVYLRNFCLFLLISQFFIFSLFSVLVVTSGNCVKMKDTCNMFIRADEAEEIDDTDEIEEVDDVGTQDGAIALGIAEEARRKNVKLYKRFNQERPKGKVILTLLIVSLILNLGFFMKLMF